MFPLFTIAIGIVVLVFGKRLSVLGAAVGALLGLGLLRLFPGSTDSWIAFSIPAILAIIGFFLAGFAKGIVGIVLMVLGALGGAAIVLGFLDILNIDTGFFDWVMAVVGGVVGLILVRRFQDWGMVILASLIGALLITRGLTALMPFLEGTIGTLLVIVLAGAGIVYQGGLFKGGKGETKGGSQPT